MLEVGRVSRPHGLRGQVVLEMVSNRRERLEKGAVLSGRAGDLRVEHAVAAPGSGGRRRFIVSFAGVDDRAAAEALRGEVLRGEPIDDPDAWWVHDLVGAQVVTPSGTGLGRVEAVEDNPASDLLVLDSGVLVPLRFVVRRERGLLTAELPEGLVESQAV